MDINEVPDSRIPTIDESRIFAGQVLNILKKCINQLNPAKELNNIVLLGLYNKELKIYLNLLRIADLGNTDIPPILSRVIFEISLTVCYLIINGDENPNLFEEFKKTSSQRTSLLIKSMESFNSITRKSAQETIGVLKKKLKDEYLDFQEGLVRGYPRSWLRDKSYFEMAKELGEMFVEMYVTFYGTTSDFIHPNWEDITKNHLSKTENGYVPKSDSSLISIYPVVNATCLVTLTIEVFTLRFSKTNKRNKKLYKQIREIHYLMHNGEPKKPFFSYYD